MVEARNTVGGAALARNGGIMWSTAQTSSGGSRWKPVVVCAMLSALASSADAQSIATLKGRVTDASGAILRGASVSVQEEDTGVQRTVTTDAAGGYQFPFLAVGTYRLAVQLLERGERARMVTLSDGNYSHVPIDTLLHGRKSVDVSALYDKASYRARLMRVEGMPMFLY